MCLIEYFAEDFLGRDPAELNVWKLGISFFMMFGREVTNTYGRWL